MYIGWKAIMYHKIEELAKSTPLSDLTKIIKINDGYIEHEFEFEGKMYDVISYKLYADKIHYYCINDFEEENINSVNDNDLNKCISKCKQNSKNIAKSLYKPVAAILKINSFYPKISFRYFYAVILYPLLDLSIENLLPPPKY